MRVRIIVNNQNQFYAISKQHMKWFVNMDYQLPYKMIDHPVKLIHEILPNSFPNGYYSYNVHYLCVSI